MKTLDLCGSAQNFINVGLNVYFSEHLCHKQKQSLKDVDIYKKGGV